MFLARVMCMARWLVASRVSLAASAAFSGGKQGLLETPQFRSIELLWQCAAFECLATCIASVSALTLACVNDSFQICSVFGHGIYIQVSDIE